MAIDCVQDRGAAADIHRVYGRTVFDQEPHVRQLGPGRSPVKRGTAYSVRETDGIWVVVQLGPEQLKGFAEDNLMD